MVTSRGFLPLSLTWTMYLDRKGRGAFAYTGLPTGSAESSDNEESPIRQPRESLGSAQPTSSVNSEGRGEVWWYKAWKTAAMTYLAITSALEMSLVSPTTPDLRQRLGLSMEQFSRSSAARSLGTMLGAVAGGLLADRGHRHVDLLVAGGCALAALSAGLVPWSGGLPALCFLSLLAGCAQGMKAAVLNSMTLCMWGANPVAMYVYHFGWSMGSPIAPLLAEPFLSPDQEISTGENDVFNISENTTKGLWWEYGDGSRVEIPYTITALLAFTCVPMFLYYQIRKAPSGYESHHKPKTTWTEVFSVGSCAEEPDGTKRFTIQVIISVLFLLVFYIGSMKADGSIMFSYVIEKRNHLNFSKEEAAQLQSAAALSHSVGRLLVIVVCYWIPIQWVMGASILGSAVTLTGVSLIGLHSPVMLWTCLCANQFCTASIFAGSFLWAEVYIKVYAVMIGIWEVGAAGSAMMFAWIDGIIYDTDQPEYTFYLANLLGWMCFVHFLVIQLNATLHVRRTRHMDDKNNGSVLPCDSKHDRDMTELEMSETNTGRQLSTQDRK